MKTPDIWGLTPQGFYRPTYVEILNVMEYKARELFGEGVNLTVRSPVGMFLRIYAWMMNILFSILEDIQQPLCRYSSGEFSVQFRPEHRLKIVGSK